MVYGPKYIDLQLAVYRLVTRDLIEAIEGGNHSSQRSSAIFLRSVPLRI